jgi:hypothetical protein
MEISGQIHARTDSFNTRNELPVPIAYDGWWVAEPLQTVLKREIFLTSSRTECPSFGCPADILVTEVPQQHPVVEFNLIRLQRLFAKRI